MSGTLNTASLGSDVSTWSEEDLNLFLGQYGIDDVDAMDREERLGLAVSLLDVPPLSSADITQALSDTRTGDDSDYEYDDKESGESSRPIVAVAPLPSASSSSSSGASDPHSTTNTEDPIPAATAELDAEQETTLTSFCEITGCPREEAKAFLEAFSWNLDSAVSLYLDQGFDGLGSFKDSTKVNSNDANGGIGSSDVAVGAGATMGDVNMFGVGGDDRNITANAAYSSTASRGIGGEGFRGAQNRQGNFNDPLPTYDYGAHDDDSGDDSDHDTGRGYGAIRIPRSRPSRPIVTTTDATWGGGEDSPRFQDKWDEDGIRLPEPARQMRLVGANSMGGMQRGGAREDPLARADAPGVEWMFPPPRHLSYPGSLQEARQVATSDGKWIMTNIQSHEEFSSNLLNRDTWTNEVVENLLRSSFIFWQRGHTSPDSANFMRMHNMSRDDLPHIAIVDPRTGAKVFNLKGFVDPGELCMNMMEFLEENNFANNKAPKIKNLDNTKRGSFEYMAFKEKEQAGNEGGGGGGGMELPQPSELSINESESLAYSYSESSVQSSNASFSQTSSLSPLSSDPPLKRESPPLSSSSSLSPAPPLPPSQTAHSYGPISEEPPTNSTDSVKVSIKLATGKSIIRRYLKHEPVSVLFAVAQDAVPEASFRRFDLATTFPTRSLQSLMQETLESCSLHNSVIAMRWID